MVYLELTMGLPRNKVKEAWQCYQKVMEHDKEVVEKVGGKYIGYWSTEYGKIGEITIMVAYPNLEVREKALQAFWQVEDATLAEGVAQWAGYTPQATVRVLRPLPGSPLQ